jgi:hypothetical protein
MPNRRAKYITDFYDVSILMPCWEGIAGFKENIASNIDFFTHNGIELVVIANENCKEVLQLPDAFPFANWKIVFSGSGPEAGRSKKLNIAVQEATNRYVVTIDPGAVCLSDAIYLLRYKLHHHPNSFAVVPSSDIKNDGDICQSLQQILHMDHVILMAERTAIVTAGGFGGFDDPRLDNVNIQRRLELTGLHKLIIPLPVSLSPAYQQEKNTSFGIVCETSPLPIIRKALYPGQKNHFPRQKEAGHRVAYDWHVDSSSNAQHLILQKLNKYHLKDPNVFMRDYGIICLLPVRNERAHLPDVLLHLDGVCDGIILLDDGSVDGSYEAAESTKLLIKAQIENKGFFDDLTNRNLLLQLAYLFKAEWFFFMDADERFDLRSCDLRKLSKNKNIDCVSFRRVHLWNKGDQYRKDLPEGVNGVMHRYRMFRNKGYMQIESEREIHFRPTPHMLNKFRSSVLLLHYGLFDDLARRKKLDAYLPQDPDGKKQGFAYDFMLDADVELGNLDDLV